jgi:3-methyladenine DNA glycosylase/8-oxoguanine DNA glycosylase
MKIKDIKSDEVRNEAVRLAQLETCYGSCKSNEEALEKGFDYAFQWDSTPQGFDFWNKLDMGTTPNTPDLKLPEKNPSK